MYKLLTTLVGLPLLSGCGGGVETPSPATAPASVEEIERETTRLNEWFDARYEEILDFSPTQKTRLGRKDDYDRIDDYSEAASDDRFEWRGATVEALQDSFDYALLTPEAQTSYDLWIYQFDQAEAARQFRRRRYVFHQMRGQHTGLPQFLITNHRVDDESDMVAYITRIGEVGRAIDQSLARAQLASAEGVHAPRFAYEAVIEQARALLTGAPFTGDGEAPLWADANIKIGALAANGEITSARADELRADAQAALINRFKPAYDALIAWAQSELPLTDDIATGVWQLPQGPAFYEERLETMTTTGMTADEIHQLGLDEVARIHAEMEAVKTQVGFDGDLQTFFAFVREDPQFYHPSTDEGRQAYLDTAREHLDFIEQRLPEYFGLLPRAELDVRRVEAFREVAGQAQHYQRGALDGSRPGIYYAHLIDMSAMPIPLMEVIAYHEGIPGHHMQIAIAQELTGIPTFRTLAGFTAFSEGWGLYAESLAVEMGAYQDPYSNFGRLSSELWRAIRLVVDTGLHSKGWSEEQAVSYFTENSPISEGQIHAEVQRYIVMPGQATAYKIGMLKIQELRARAESALGASFDVSEYHDMVLGGGALPLSILEQRADDWVAANTGVVR